MHQVTQIQILDNDHILIQSETFGEIKYIVTVKGLNVLDCTCMAQQYLYHKRGDCKHISEVNKILNSKY